MGERERHGWEKEGEQEGRAIGAAIASVCRPKRGRPITVLFCATPFHFYKRARIAGESRKSHRAIADEINVTSARDGYYESVAFSWKRGATKIATATKTTKMANH